LVFLRRIEPYQGVTPTPRPFGNCQAPWRRRPLHRPIGRPFGRPSFGGLWGGPPPPLRRGGYRSGAGHILPCEALAERGRGTTRSVVDPPWQLHRFCFLGPVPASKAPPRRRRRRFASGSWSLLLSSFGFLQLHEESEGLAPFRSRTLGRHLSDLSAASLMVRKRESWVPRPDGREKTARSIRCPAGIRPLEKSPIRGRAFG
jgi:hypothetical protein